MSDILNAYTSVCNVCFNVDVVTGSSQLEEVNMTYMPKLHAILIFVLLLESPQHLVENRQ